MDNKQIVNSIKAICKEHKITITKLEETLGISQGLISRWSKSDPSLSKIIDIADYFNLSLDDIVGYKKFSNDAFIEKLILQTANGSLKWFNYTKSKDDPKQYSQLPKEMDKQPTNIKEISYFSCINKGYISLYGTYKNSNVKKPSNIFLFIQPDYDATLIKQDYTTSQLISLWLKVLYNLNQNAPDEIKAEELKNSFMLGDNKKQLLNPLQDETVKELLNNPSFMKLLETVNTKEFKNLQQTFYNPEFQNTLQTINQIQKILM